MAAEAPAHWLIVSDSESEEEAKEANDPENWAGEAAPRSISKRLRSLFKHRVDAQDADKEEQIQAQEIQAQEIQAQEGEHDQNMEESSLAVNIAQLIPTHLRPEFAATVASSIRANQEQGSSKMTHIQVQKVTKDIQDLLRKPPRVIHPTPMVAEHENNRNEEEEAKQERINKILNKAGHNIHQKWTTERGHTRTRKRRSASSCDPEERDNARDH